MLIALYCVALVARLVPLTFSPLPYSTDGFAFARIANGITATGTWRIDAAGLNNYNEKLPGFSLVWAAVSMVGGLQPLAHVQAYIAIIASLVVLPAYLLGVKATGRRVVGFSAGLFVALFGSFLLLTSSVSKEAMGLLVFPVIVLLFHERADPRKRALAVVLLLFLPFLHPLTTLLTLGMVASLVVLTHRPALSRGRFSLRALAVDVMTGPALAVAAIAYYVTVNLQFLSDLFAPDAFVLFLAIALLLTAIIASMARPAKRRIGRRLVTPVSRAILPPVIAVAVLVANARTSIFTGVLGTQPAFLWILPAIAVVAALAVVGYQMVRRTSNRANDLIVSMLIAPVALILFGFFRGLDPQSLVIVYRSVDFWDYALAVLVGVAVAAAWKALRPRRYARAALAMGLLAVLLATTPMAWNTQAVFGVQNTTTPEEFRALAVLSSFGARNVTTDEHLAEVGASWFGYRANGTLPLTLRSNGSVAGSDYAIVLERWTTVGAQLHPAPNLVLSWDTIRSFLEANRVVSVFGLPGDRVFVVQIMR